MGRAKEKFYIDNERSYSVGDELICFDCLMDEDLKNMVEKNGIQEKCSFCGAKKSCLPIEDIFTRFDESISEFYQSPDDCGIPFHEDEEGWENSVTWIGDLLMGVPTIFNNPNAEKYMVDTYSEKLWTRFTDYYPNEELSLRRGWEKYCSKIKDNPEYEPDQDDDSTYPDEDSTYHVITIAISALLSMNSTLLNSGIDIYRVRIDKSEFFHCAKELGAPQDKYAKYANRFSKAGEGFFYGAELPQTALLEIFNGSYENCFSFSIFKTITNLNIIDLSIIPDVPGFYSENSAERESLLFLHNFVESLRAPISKDSDPHIEYLPTQKICEYLKNEYYNKNKITLDGIKYCSSKNDEICYFLFAKNSDCIDAKEFDEGKKGLLVLSAVEHMKGDDVRNKFS